MSESDAAPPVAADPGPTEPGFSAAGHFNMSIAHYFIIGASLFAIFWGIVNIFLVSQFTFIISHSPSL